MTPKKLPQLAQSVHSSPSTLLLILGTFIMIAILLTSDQPFFVQGVEASVADTNVETACLNSARNLTTIESQFTVAESVDRLQMEIQRRTLNVLAVIDHASVVSADGEEIDAPLRPTVLILFDGSTIGASLLQSEQSIGIDLPLKYLVWQDACDQVHIGYTETNVLQNRHKIREQDEAFEEIGDLLDSMALAAALNLDVE